MSYGAGEYDEAKIQADCRTNFGIGGDADWAVISLGGMDWSSASNIVFSNGEYDPWKIGAFPASLGVPCHCKRPRQIGGMLRPPVLHVCSHDLGYASIDGYCVSCVTCGAVLHCAHTGGCASVHDFIGRSPSSVMPKPRRDSRLTLLWNALSNALQHCSRES